MARWSTEPMVAVMASHPAKLEHPIVAAVYDAYMWPQEWMGFRRSATRTRRRGRSQGLMRTSSPRRWASSASATARGSSSTTRARPMWAARLWWMLRAFGFDQAAVLNGGWTAWQLERRPVSSQPSSYPPTTFTPAPRRGLFVGKDEVLRAIDDPTACIVCALARRQYRGERREYGRRRGHIPGACNVSAWRILDRRTQRYRRSMRCARCSVRSWTPSGSSPTAAAASQPPATRSSCISSATQT